jgi:hypothetical protein
MEPSGDIIRTRKTAQLTERLGQPETEGAIQWLTPKPLTPKPTPRTRRRRPASDPAGGSCPRRPRGSRPRRGGSRTSCRRAPRRARRSVPSVHSRGRRGGPLLLMFRGAKNDAAAGSATGSPGRSSSGRPTPARGRGCCPFKNPALYGLLSRRRNNHCIWCRFVATMGLQVDFCHGDRYDCTSQN